MKGKKPAFFDFVQSADFAENGCKLRFGKGFVEIKQKKELVYILYTKIFVIKNVHRLLNLKTVIEKINIFRFHVFGDMGIYV